MPNTPAPCDGYNNLSDDELTQKSQLIKTLLNEMIEWDAEDAIDYPDEVELRKPRYKIFNQSLRDIEIIQRQRLEQEEEDVEDDIPEIPVCFPAPPQSTPFRHYHNVITNSPPDILVPPPFPPSPNISVQLPQSHRHPPHNHHFPDIATPPPLPLKPNIPVHQ
jgi:hypothetical protein